MPNLTYKTHDAIIASWGSPLTLAILTQAPNPDGTGITEPTDGYARQTIAFDKVQSGGITYLTNDANIIFGPATPGPWTTVTYFALFDADDDLVCYGRLRTARTNPTGEVIAFPTGTVELRLR